MPFYLAYNQELLIYFYIVLFLTKFFRILDIHNTKGVASSPDHNKVGKGRLEAYPLKQVVKKVDWHDLD